MDPEALLDYALFQLTPTRTRCDLLLVSGGKSEKLASGLVEPFVSHLKFAKDQIPKGGYSITLRPPETDASWFTKATFQRFVRFVSTPEVLERFARLEKEISQTESSVQPNEFANSNVAGQAKEGIVSTANGITKQSTTSSKVKVEDDGNDDAAQEENSKIRLQHLLETRKSLLRKEQAMAYARALAAGFELDYIDNLLDFSDAFGASRLRDACTDFKELCKKKHSDGLWMDELAAMEAYSQPDLSFSGASGVILACESTPLGQNNMLNLQNGISSGKLMENSHLNISPDSTANQSNSDSNKDSNVPASDQIASTPPAKVEMQMQWPKQIPHYMFNFQGPGQQMPPYQPYPYPTMQNAPQYYPGNTHWRQNMNESRHSRTSEPDHHRRKRSSRKKEKSGAGFSEEEQTESADSDTGTDSEVIAYKKNDKKKSSKTVVIRNINYISSKRRNGESDEGDSDDDSSVVDELLVDGDFLEQNVGDVIETLDISHDRTSNKKKRSGKANWDLFQNLLMREKEAECPNPTSVHLSSEEIQMQKTFQTNSFIVNERSEVNGGRSDGGIYNTLSSEGDCSQVEVSKKIVPIDDSFMVQTQKSVDDHYGSQWKTDINFVSDLIVHENGASPKKFGVSAPHEPDDLRVVLSRNSGFESTRASWSPEMNYGVEASFKESVKKLSVVETDDLPEGKVPENSKSTDGRNSNSDKQTRPRGLPGSLGKNRFDILSKSKKTLPTNRPMIQKSKLEKEEESRRKMEDLAIQRQKRIAERTAASVLTPAGSKSVTVASSKHKSQSTNPKLRSTISAKNQLVPGQIKRR